MQILEQLASKNVNKWTINPTKEINGLKFGSDRDIVRKKFGEPKKEFKKSKYGKNTTDDYGDFHVFYNKDNELEAIEIFSGEVSLNGKRIMPGNVKSVIDTFNGFADEAPNYINKELSVGIQSSNDGAIKSVLIGCKDYF